MHFLDYKMFLRFGQCGVSRINRYNPQMHGSNWPVETEEAVKWCSRSVKWLDRQAGEHNYIMFNPAKAVNQSNSPHVGYLTEVLDIVLLPHAGSGA